jgi:hypothetical protein
VRLGTVWFRATGGDEIATQSHRHQQIGHAAQMYVPDLAMIETELDAAESIRPHVHAVPLLDDAGDQCAEVDGAHSHNRSKT